MLLLKQIYDRCGSHISAPYMCLHNKDHLYKRLYVDVYDTETGEIKIKILIRCNKEIPNILGIFFYCNEICLIKITDKLWNLLDYIDKPKYCGRDPEVNLAYDYRNNENGYILCQFPLTLEPLDENYIFWRSYAGNYYTIYELYDFAFRLEDVSINKDLYVRFADKSYYQLSFNKDVIKFMTRHITKSRVLRRNKK